MGFKELVSEVQSYSGFTSQQSIDGLEIMVETIAVRLEESVRRAFAAQLPEPLSDIALTVLPSEENSRGDLVGQFMAYENLGEKKAKKQMQAAWRALRVVISQKLRDRILTQLPHSTSIYLA